MPFRSIRKLTAKATEPHRRFRCPAKECLASADSARIRTDTGCEDWTHAALPAQGNRAFGGALDRQESWAASCLHENRTPQGALIGDLGRRAIGVNHRCDGRRCGSFRGHA